MNNEGGCDMEFEGVELMDVAGQCGKHIVGTTDNLHKTLRDMMTTNHTEEEKKKWFKWFQGEWDKKAET